MKDGEAASPAIEIRAFGAAAVCAAPGGEPLPLGMKGLGLCIYLAEQAPRPVTRDVLVELFWERVAPAQGKGSLRQELRRIKKTLGAEAFADIFTVSDTHIGLRPDRILYDARALLEAADAQGVEALDRLLTLFSGEFLVDNSARAECFQDWARERRGYFNDRVVAALARLADVELDEGRAERAQRAAERISAIDPLHEKGCELMMRSHIASGRRAQARALFERFRMTMIRELGAEPERALAELVTAPAAAPRRPAEPVVARPSKPTIAVVAGAAALPESLAYLSQGVTSQLVANLSKSAWIRIAALNLSPFEQSLGTAPSGQRDLRDFADYLLRVDVRAHDGKIAILSTLSRVLDGETIFTAETEDFLDDILTVQRDVARRIASIFEPMVIDDQASRESEESWREPEQLDYWRYLMRARWLFWLTRPSANREARRLLEKALEINPRDVPTLCLTAFTHMLDAWSDWTADVEGSVENAQRWAKRAVRVAPNDGWAQLTLGVMSSTPDGLDEAKSRVSHALRLSPSLAVAVGEMARYHAFAGETAEAIRLGDEALALSPYDVHSGLWLRSQAVARWLEGDLAASLDLVDFALVIRPGWFQNHYFRAAVLAEQGALDEARAALARGEKLMGSYSYASLRIGHPFQNPDHMTRFAEALNRAGGRFAPA